MELALKKVDSRELRFQARAKKARGMARWVNLALVMTVGTAIWQDRALAPPVHDGLKVGAEYVAGWIENSDQAKGYIMAMTNFSSPDAVASVDGYSGITKALLSLGE